MDRNALEIIRQELGKFRLEDEKELTAYEIHWLSQEIADRLAEMEGKPTCEKCGGCGYQHYTRENMDCMIECDCKKDKPKMMVCERADDCNGGCTTHVNPHEYEQECNETCIHGSKCVPVEDATVKTCDNCKRDGEYPLAGLCINCRNADKWQAKEDMQGKIEPLDTEHDVESWRMCLKLNEVIRKVNKMGGGK